MITFKSKSEIVEKVKQSISSKPVQAVKALMKLYSFQTSEEQNSESSKYTNGVGFTGNDAQILSSFAKDYMKRGSLTDKQMNLLYSKIAKYAKQLVEQAISKGLYIKKDGVWTINN